MVEGLCQLLAARDEAVPAPPQESPGLTEAAELGVLRAREGPPFFFFLINFYWEYVVAYDAVLVSVCCMVSKSAAYSYVPSLFWIPSHLRVITEH